MIETRVVATSDRSWVDHGALQSEIEKPNGEGFALCGLRLKGFNWFVRGKDNFTGNMAYHCKRCVKNLRKELEDDTRRSN